MTSPRRAPWPLGLIAVLAGAAIRLALLVAHAAHGTWVIARQLWEVLR